MKTAQFVDDKARAWTLRADTHSLERVRDLAGIDLTHLLNDQDVISKLTESPAVVVQTLWAMCQPQAVQRDIDPEDFGASLYESLDDAFDALLGVIPFFFLRHKRGLAAAIVAKFLEAEIRSVDRATQIMQSDKINQTIDQAIDTAERNAFAAINQRIDAANTGGSGSTSSPESSESTQDR